MKPSSSRRTTTGTWPISVNTASARSIVAGAVQGAPHNSTTGTRCGGLTGCATRQRARPASFSVKCDAGIADVELATFMFERLGQVFLHPVCGFDRRRQVGRVFDPLAGRRGIGDEAVLLLLSEACSDERRCRFELRWNAVVEAHAPPGTGEDHCPRPADQPGAYDCRCLFHRVTSRVRVVADRNPRAALSPCLRARRCRVRVRTRGRQAPARDRDCARRSSSPPRHAVCRTFRTAPR
jgi:hypothetical protein